ncbi:hypothetical protein GJAV_G00203160 [Gymnothorax javanicus]|nr:hypothetical protein GJAV_G00203160 [Gymnothorax javanicus]
MQYKRCNLKTKDEEQNGSCLTSCEKGELSLLVFRHQRSAFHCRLISCHGTMGRHFGDLAKIRHVITYSISPFEQRAFPNYFSKGIPNVWRRFTASVFKVAPPMVLLYVTYTWGNHVHEQGKRKDPSLYENDE